MLTSSNSFSPDGDEEALVPSTSTSASAVPSAQHEVQVRTIQEPDLSIITDADETLVEMTPIDSSSPFRIAGPITNKLDTNKTVMGGGAGPSALRRSPRKPGPSKASDPERAVSFSVH